MSLPTFLRVSFVHLLQKWLSCFSLAFAIDTDDSCIAGIYEGGEYCCPVDLYLDGNAVISQLAEVCQKFSKVSHLLSRCQVLLDRVLHKAEEMLFLRLCPFSS